MGYGAMVRLFAGGTWLPTFLLRDDFTTTASAPLSSPRTAEPGPGTLTITDTNNKLSIAAGKATFATAGAGSDPVLFGSQITRAAGLACVGEVTVTSDKPRVGWDNDQAGQISDCILFTGTTLTAIANGTAISGDSYATSTSYKLAAILRSAGLFYLIKGGVFTSWTMLWVSVEGTGNLYPALQAADTTTVFTSDFLRALQLPAPFSSDYGIATQQLSGARSVNDTFTHEGNCVIEFTQTTVPSVGATLLNIRRQDANNYWRININNTGDITVSEVVAGGSTNRIFVSAVVSNGHRIVTVADGSTIRIYSNNVLRGTYASASNFATSTAGEVPALGTGGAISDIVSWPRTLSSPASTYLDLAVA